MSSRVDFRGTENSEGRLIEYEYTDQEQEDGEVVIDWLSKQAFSTGRVGMFGISSESWPELNTDPLLMVHDCSSSFRRKPPRIGRESAWATRMMNDE